MMRKNRINQAVFAAIGVLVIAIVVILAYIAYLMLGDAKQNRLDFALESDGVMVIEPPIALPDYTLTDENGEPVALSALDGQPTLLTFGFTHCPDVCPITLGEMRQIHEGLGDLADDLDFVFISVDGERDTPQVLDTYLTTLRVNDFVLGMTGTEAELREFAIPYGVEFIYGEPDALGNYTVEHTAGMFLLDGERNWVRRYRYGTPSGRIVTDLREFLQRH